jgi:hypothetical protein
VQHHLLRTFDRRPDGGHVLGRSLEAYVRHAVRWRYCR